MKAGESSSKGHNLEVFCGAALKSFQKLPLEKLLGTTAFYELPELPEWFTNASFPNVIHWFNFENFKKSKRQSTPSQIDLEAFLVLKPGDILKSDSNIGPDISLPITNDIIVILNSTFQPNKYLAGLTEHNEQYLQLAKWFPNAPQQRASLQERFPYTKIIYVSVAIGKPGRFEQKYDLVTVQKQDQKEVVLIRLLPNNLDIFFGQFPEIVSYIKDILVSQYGSSLDLSSSSDATSQTDVLMIEKDKRKRQKGKSENSKKSKKKTKK